MKEITLKIEGMKCTGCVKRIDNILSNIKGIKNWEISLENNTIKLIIKNKEVVNEVINKINSLDFKVIV